MKSMNYLLKIKIFFTIYFNGNTILQANWYWLQFLTQSISLKHWNKKFSHELEIKDSYLNSIKATKSSGSWKIESEK